MDEWWVDGWMGGWLGGWMGGWMMRGWVVDRWVDEWWTDGWMRYIVNDCSHDCNCRHVALDNPPCNFAVVSLSVLIIYNRHLF